MSETSASDEHVVFFTTALGVPAAERHPSQQSAVSRVEILCNEDHVQDAKVYALVPVPCASVRTGTSPWTARPSWAPSRSPEACRPGDPTAVGYARGRRRAGSGHGPDPAPDLGEDASPVAAPELDQNVTPEPSQEPAPSDANRDESETVHGTKAGSTYGVDGPVSDVLADAF